MSNQQQQAELFHSLHVRGNPLVLYNVWDAGSTKAVAAAGARAIATGSWSVANANGYADGERIPLALAIDNLRRIVAATELPVTVDLESGYSDIAETVKLAIEAGAVGCNLEDSFPADGKLRAIGEQCARIRQMRAAAEAAGLRFFINARTDVFFQGHPYEEAVERARAYADAGADGIFTPGVEAVESIARLAEASLLPLNIMVGDATPGLRVLAEHGVARVSYGPRPYLMAMKSLEDAARAVF
jgi:2-methylisocitrate lyase-like PEP mutase family enzyme